MADTPKIETPTLEQAKEWLRDAAEFTKEKGEALLATLKDKTEKATTDAEKVRINGVIVKIKQLSEGAQLHTENMLDALKSSLTADEKNIVADADSSLGEKIGAKVKIENAIENTQTALSSAVNSLKKGDITGAKDIAEGIIEGVGKNGETIREYSGMAAFSKVFEPISQDGFSLENLVKCFGNLFKFIFGFGKFQEVLGKIDEVKNQASDVVSTLEAGKEDINGAFTSAQEAFSEFKKIPGNKNPEAYNAAARKFWESFKKLEAFKDKLTPEQKQWLETAENEPPFNALGILKDKEKRDKWIESQVGPVCKNLGDEFYAGGDLSVEQVEKVRKALQNMDFGADVVEKIRARFDDPTNPVAFSAADPANLLTEILCGNFQMFGMLLSVIPTHRIIWNVTKKAASEGAEMYEYNASVVFDKIRWVKPVEMKFTPASLGKMFEGYKDDGVTQDMILMQMYRVNGFFASIVGAGINTGYSALYAALDTSHGANGIDEFFKVINKDYKGLSDGMEQIEKAFAGNSKFESWLAESIRLELATIKKNWALIALAEEIEKNPAADISKMLARKEYSELRIVESEVIKNAKNIRAYLGTFISTESVNPASFSRIGGRALGTAAGAGNDFIDQLQHTKKFQSALMKGDTMSKLKEVFGSLKILKLPRLADKVALYFKDTDSAINTLRQAGASGGTFLAEMFRSLPTVGLIIGGVDISMSNSRDFEGSKLRELGTIAAQVLVPFVGPVMLMTDPNTALTFKKDGQIENLGTGIAAVGMVGLDLCLLGKALGKGIPGGVEFFMERPKDVLRVFRGITRTGTLISRAAPRLVGAETAVAIEKILVKWGRFGKAAAALVVLGFAGYAYAESNKDYEKELSEAGLFDQKTGNITQKAIGEFAKLDTGKKKEFIDALSHVVFKEEDATISHAKSVIDEKNGSYTLVVDTKEHAAKWGTAIAQKKHLFDDELAKLGIRVDIVDKETYQEKKWKEDEKNVA